MDKRLIEKIKEISQSELSFYIYDGKGIEKSAKALTDNFKEVQFLYSAKTNPNSEIISSLVKNGFGIDAASVEEVIYGVKAGLGKDKIYYSAPGKTKEMIKATINNSVIIADSLSEIDRIEEVAEELGIVAEIGLRINPNFTMDSNLGVSSKFGIDENVVLENAEKFKAYSEYCNIVVKGIHVHSRSQELDFKVLKEYYEKMFNLADKVSEALDISLEFINMGGGLGITYAKGDKDLDIKKLGKEMDKMVLDYREKNEGIKVLIETGRYVVGKNGTYVTTVVDKKESMGRNYLILAATLNGFARPSIAALVESHAEGAPKASEPLYTKPGAFEFDVIKMGEEGNTSGVKASANKGAELEAVDVYGSLCTATDIIAKDIDLPKAEIGDLFAISNAGSYAAVLTAMQFASLGGAKEHFIK